jgi:hypothetical protein
VGGVVNGVVWDCEISMDFARGVHEETYDLAAGVDRTSIEEKPRGIGNQRIQVYHLRSVGLKERHRGEVRQEGYPGDVPIVINGEVSMANS